jgi:Uma2 family endonuclease
MSKNITNINQLDLQGSYTYADYLTWKIDTYLELIKGKIFQMAAPSVKHQRIAWNLNTILGNYFWKKNCRAFAAPFDVRLTRFDKKKNTEVITVVQPDICVICDLDKIDEQGCIGSPDLVIEILSPGNSKKEMKDKFEVYEESGVKEYWIVSPIEKTIQIFRLNEQGIYIGLRPLIEEEFATTPLFEDLKVELAEVFHNV